MVVTDPVADFLTRIRNAHIAGHASVRIPDSKLKRELARVLVEEGYITAQAYEEGTPYGHIRLTLKYLDEKPVITGLRRESKSGQRKYVSVSEIPNVLSGYGIAVLSTSKGVMTGKRAKELGVGGEYLCSVW